MRRALLWFCLTAVLFPACAPPRDAPETQLRAAVSRAAGAAEQHEMGALRQLVSERYRDDQGYDREGVLALVRGVLLAYGNVHVVTRIKALEFAAPQLAMVTVIAGMAGRKPVAAEDLNPLHANLYRFDLEFREEAPGTWRVTAARWETASPREAL